MAQVERARKPRGRTATSAALRAFATLTALLLTLSSLGQVAHFLLVSHTICAEHGELLELGRPQAAAHERESTEKERARAGSSETIGAHEHCQMLARNQREQSILPAPALNIEPAGVSTPTAIFCAETGVSTTLPPLAVAPKTSPPRFPSARAS